MIIEKVNALMADQEFMKKLLECKDIPEALACLNQAGAECSEEEGMGILDVVFNALRENAMNLDDMDQVAGGTGENNSTALGSFLKGIVDIGANTMIGMVTPKKTSMIAGLTDQVLRTVNTVVNVGTGSWDTAGTRWYNPAVDGALEDAAKKARMEAAAAEMASLPVFPLQ